jgi:excinuclease ABC subunit A
MAAADHIVDIGPRAGVHGGSIVFSGTYDQICAPGASDTGEYLSGRKRVSVKKKERKPF